MLRVRIELNQRSSVVDFSGVCVRQPDATGRIPVGEEQGVIHVSGEVPDDEAVRQIWRRLEIGQVVGEGDGFTWKLEGC
jgi:hypothetical protein